MREKVNANPVPPFQFKAHQIRTTTEKDGSTRFVAKDVCAALDISWSSATLKSIPEGWKGAMEIITPSGKQKLAVISEPAVYKLAFRSHKPEAEAFTEWVAAEVLPQIRKTGRYETEAAAYDAEAIRLKAERNATIRAFDAMTDINKAGGCVFHLKQYVYYRRLGLLRFEAAQLVRWKLDTAEKAEKALKKVGIEFPPLTRPYADAIHAAIEDATFDAVLRKMANGAIPIMEKKQL
jgi:prophage antirepressor-like protein